MYQRGLRFLELICKCKLFLLFKSNMVYLFLVKFIVCIMLFLTYLCQVYDRIVLGSDFNSRLRLSPLGELCHRSGDIYIHHGRALSSEFSSEFLVNNSRRRKAENDSSCQGSRLELALASKLYSELNAFIYVSKNEYTAATYSHVPYTH